MMRDLVEGLFLDHFKIFLEKLEDQTVFETNGAKRLKIQTDKATPSLAKSKSNGRKSFFSERRKKSIDNT